MTPIQLTVTAGMLQNQGIKPNANCLTAISSYETAQPISSWLTAINKAVSIRLITVAQGGNAATSNARTRMSNITIGRMANIGTNTVPALGDSLPSNISGVTLLTLTAPGLSNYARISANQIANVNDLGIFCQAFTSALGYATSTNKVINTNLNVNDYLGPTFTNMTDLTTGGLSSVSVDLPAFGEDVRKLGQAIDLANLGNFGAPSALLRQLLTVAGILPEIIAELAKEGIKTETVLELRNPSYEIDDTLQAGIYRAMQRVTAGNGLELVLQILDVTTAGLESMADLLNPIKIFPNSFRSLRVKTSAGSTPIYLDQSGSVNTNLVTLLPAFLIKDAS